MVICMVVEMEEVEIEEEGDRKRNQKSGQGSSAPTVKVAGIVVDDNVGRI